MNDKTAALNDIDFMTALLDIVIPARDDGILPGAGSLGLAPDVAAAIQADATLGPIVEAGARAIRDVALAEHPEGLSGMSPPDGAKVIEAQLADHGFFVLGLLRYLYVAYYQHPRVLPAIGEPPRAPFPEGFEVEPTDPGLLEKLEAWRQG